MGRKSQGRHPNHAPKEALDRTVGRLHPDHRRIAQAALVVFLFTAAAKLAVAGREIVLAWRFGRGYEVDAYNIALTYSTWLPLALVSVMTVVLVPLIVRSEFHDAANRHRFLREFTGAGLMAGLFIGIATWMVAPWLVQVLGPELPIATRDVARVMLQSFAPVAILTVLIGVYATRLQAANDHRYALAEGLPPLSVVLFLLAWQADTVTPLIVGTLVGFAVQCAWLARSSPSIGTSNGLLSFGMKAPQWRGLWRGAVIMGAGQLAMSFSQPIDQWFAAGVGSGAIATLGYANRLVSLGMALGATVISRATLPIFAEAASRGEGERIRHYAMGWSGLMLLIGALVATIVWLLSPWLVGLVFERGAFSSADTDAVAAVLRMGVWQVPPYFAGLVLVSKMASAGSYHLIGIVAIASILVKVATTSVLTEILGLNGIMLGSVLMYGTSMVLCLVAVLHGQESKLRASG